MLFSSFIQSIFLSTQIIFKDITNINLKPYIPTKIKKHWSLEMKMYLLMCFENMLMCMFSFIYSSLNFFVKLLLKETFRISISEDNIFGKINMNFSFLFTKKNKNKQTNRQTKTKNLDFHSLPLTILTTEKYKIKQTMGWEAIIFRIITNSLIASLNIRNFNIQSLIEPIRS